MGEKKDVVVVGGGLAGLAAATYLARHGRSVEVLERAEAPGGRARTRVQDGFAFNLGAHALYARGAASAVLRELGIPYAGAPPPTPFLAASGDRLEPLPTGLGSMVASRLLPWRAKLEVARWYAGLGRLQPQALAGVSAAEWLARAVPHPAARAFAETVARVATYAADMGQHSAESVVRQLQQARRGVLYLHGGWQTLVDGLRRGLEGLGVPLRTRDEVVSVQPRAGGFEVTLGEGRRVDATGVVLAVPPAVVADLVSPLAPALAEAARAAIPVRASCLDVALARLPRRDRAVVLGVGRPLYLSVHSQAARLAPEGGALIHTARYLDAGPSDPQAVERELEELLDRVQPGWRDVLVRRRFLPDMTVSHALVTAAQGGLAGRPSPEAAGVPGLYLAGDWIGAEGLLADASLASARRAAHALLAGSQSRSAA